MNAIAWIVSGAAALGALVVAARAWLASIKRAARAEGHAAGQQEGATAERRAYNARIARVLKGKTDLARDARARRDALAVEIVEVEAQTVQDLQGARPNTPADAVAEATADVAEAVAEMAADDAFEDREP